MARSVVISLRSARRFPHCRDFASLGACAPRQVVRPRACRLSWLRAGCRRRTVGEFRRVRDDRTLRGILLRVADQARVLCCGIGQKAQVPSCGIRLA